MSLDLRVLCLSLPLLLAACDQGAPIEPGEALSGGQASVKQADHNAFSLPSANLTPARRLDFAVGNSFFRNPWVIAPSTTTARDGLGPLFNTNACQNCHIKDGRGHPPGAGAVSAASMLLRLSIAGDDSAEHRALRQRLGVVPEPNYGGQLQDMAIPGVSPEGRIRLDWDYRHVELADGSRVELRSPMLRLDRLAYGPLHEQTQYSLRVAPPMIGLGLLEAIAEADILASADPDDTNGDGISGRPNRVWDRAAGQTVLGRFGWKAGQPSLNQQNAEAFAGDMGLTSSLIPRDNCSASQADCRALPHGGEPEVADNILATVLFYSRNLAVPMRRQADSPRVLAGKALFHETGCAACHSPRFVTRSDAAEPELASQTIRPYSDLLLHDMGEGLADNRTEFAASGREWRTPPLWGIGLTQAVNGHTQFLHDGRARNLLEAILWHGGEAQAARDAVTRLTRDEREALLAFLESL